MFKQTALTSWDSYKIGHPSMLPSDMTKGYSNFTPRNLQYMNADIPKEYKVDSVVWFGLQGFLQELNYIWKTTFFEVDWPEIESEISSFYAPFCGPNGVTLNHFKKLWNLGYLPLCIKSLPEGTMVPAGVPVLTITNTQKDFGWLPNTMETWLSSELWKPVTSATRAFVYRKIIQKYADLTGSFQGFIDWQAHDFSVRGMSGIFDAAKSGAGHLLSSLGTDNLPAVKYINDCYRGKETFVGGSVPATEHAIMCAGRQDGEVETYRRLINQFPSGVLSIVSDTWDYFNVITNTAKELKEEILNRVPDSLGLAKVVFRPDSGDPVEIICGIDIPDFTSNAKTLDDAVDFFAEDLVDAEADEAGHGECGNYEVSGLMSYQGNVYNVEVQIDWNRYDKQYYYIYSHQVNNVSKIELTPQQKGSVDCLWEIFGGTINEKGYKTLNQRVGLIYGDSITVSRADEILSRLAKKGYSADNIVFGVGSYTYNYVTRDTCGFAMKSTSISREGVPEAIFKDPKTDSGTKKSAKGLLRVEKIDGKYVLFDQQTEEQEQQGELKVVYLDGEIKINDSFAILRERLNEYR